MTRNNSENKFKSYFGLVISTISILGSLFTGFIWMNCKFNSLDNRLTKIETILIVKNIVTREMLGTSATENEKDIK